VAGIPEGLVDPSELVERFDRTRTGRLHVEDFAQVADVAPLFKYSESNVTYDTLAAGVRLRQQPAVRTLALSLNEERLPTSIDLDDFRRLADHAGADPEQTVEWAVEAVHRLRDSWTETVRSEADKRFAALADHYTDRLPGTNPM